LRAPFHIFIVRESERRGKKERGKNDLAHS